MPKIKGYAALMTEPQYLRSQTADDESQPKNDIWRKEVHSHVARFRTRRGRRLEGAFSMRFPFPSDEPVVASTVTNDETQPELNSRAGKVEDGATVAEAESDVSFGVAGTLPPGSAEFIPSEDPLKSVTASSEDVERLDPIPESDPVLAGLSAESAPPPLAETQSEPELPARPRPRPKRKVIAFPRQPGAAENVHRLADPVLPEQPRILDVPEELEAYPTTPFLEGLQFEPSTQVSAPAADRVALPFHAASIPHRMYAAVVDCSLVLVAAFAFGFITHEIIADLPLTKPTRITAALVPLLLWAIFQYLLLVYAGRTAGMRVAGLRLRTFNGHLPSLRHRRNRVLGSYLSTASLGMGQLWAFVDVDSLCWHDRISGTYLTRRE
jgi:uncharacterized RDD family membrane protein YckC